MEPCHDPFSNHYGLQFLKLEDRSDRVIARNHAGIACVSGSRIHPQRPTNDNPLIEKLADAISNTKWTGSFTLTGNEGNPKTETYEIKDAQYEGDDKWLLTARIAYGDRDITVPIPLEIKWAGRTPVITVDNLTIPPLGTFDARVLMRRGSYAGTWAHGDKGGHLFGVYEKVEDTEKPAEAAVESSSP